MNISVVIATYNGEKYIEEQLESILAQSVRVNEIIICDDASSDETLKICNDKLGGGNIKYSILQHDINQGVVSSFKEALFASTGDIVFFCDQDDVWLPNKVATFISKFKEEKDVDLLFSNAYITNADLKPTGKYLWDTIKFRPSQQEFKECLQIEMLKRNIFTGMCMALRRNLIDDGIWFSKDMLHDECIGWYALMKGGVDYIDKPLVYYRQHSNNVIGDSRHRKFVSIKDTVYNVQKSNNRYKNKFADVMNLASQNEVFGKELKNAYSFYEWKSNLLNTSRIISLAQSIHNCLNGTYGKYSSKTEHSFMKDIFIILFH